MIRFKLEADGTFIVGDTETGHTAIAFPGTAFAVMAQYRPECIGRTMIQIAGDTDLETDDDPDFDLLNWGRLERSPGRAGRKNLAA